MAKMVTMKAIAEAAGVSVPTVSRILRGETLNRYSDVTQEKVRKTAQELGWRPNLLVSGIRKNRSYTIGVMVPPFDTHWTQVLYAIHDALLSKGYIPLVLFPKEYGDMPSVRDYGQEKSATRMIDRLKEMPRNEKERLYGFVDRRVDGIITFPLLEQDARDYALHLAKEGWPVVTIDQQLSDEINPLDIEVNESAAMKLLVDHLLEQGRKDLMFIGRGDDVTWVRRRRKGFYANVPPHIAARNLKVSDNYEDLPDLLGQVLDNTRDIDAILCDTDHCAGRVIHFLEKRGVRIPEDIAVTGFGNISFEMFHHGITTIDQQPWEIGRLAAESVLAMREGKGPAGHLTVEPSLIVRDSTGR